MENKKLIVLLTAVFLLILGSNSAELNAINTGEKNIQTSSTSKLGHIRSSDTEIHNKDFSDSSKAGQEFTHAVYYIKQRALYNDKLYYLISKKPSASKGVVGWVESSELSTHDHVGVDKKDRTFFLNGSGEAFTKAWGGNKDQVYDDLSSHRGGKFNVHLTERVGNNIWYRGNYNGKTMWVHESFVNKPDYEGISRLGHLKSNASIHPTLGDSMTGKTLHTEKYTHSVYYIKRQAHFQGDLYYLISNQASPVNGTVGWVKANELSTHSHVGVDKERKTFYFNGKGEAYTRAWGGNKNLVYEDLSNHQNGTFNVHLTERVGGNTWYRGNYNGKTMWVHESQVSDIPRTHTSRLGHLRSNASIYPTLEDSNTGNALNTSEYTHAVYYIKQKANYQGDLYYLISERPSYKKGVVGWVKASELSTNTHNGVDKQNKTFYFNGSGQAFTKAWGGSKDLVYSDMSQHEGGQFNVHLTESVGGNTWYRGNYNGKTMWLHESFLIRPEKSNTSKLGHLRSNSSIYSNLGDTMSGDTLKTSEYTDSVYYIKQQAEFRGGLYYLISNKPSHTNGVVGWVPADDLSTNQHSSVDQKQKTFYFNGIGSAYTKPWGGSKNLVYGDMTQHAAKVFNINLTESVGGNIWYRGNYNGKTIWVHESFVGSNPVQRTSYDLDYNRMVDIQVNHGNPKYDGAGQVKADKANVSYYLNPANFSEGSPGYMQFLLLDRSTNLPASELNSSFLNGAGTLNGTGEAFIEAGDKYGVNELYLIAHALHESGRGTSTLARGVGVDSSGNVIRENGNIVRNESHPDVARVVYNMFGYGAVDNNPTNGGAKYAFDREWFSPSEAVVGGARQIVSSYISQGQNTLYKMKWDPEYAADNNWLGKQYATHIRWAEIQANFIYDMLGDNVNSYALRYDVPSYNNQPGADGSVPPPPQENTKEPKDYLAQSYPSGVVGEIDVSSGNLNFRKGPSTDYDRIDSIPDGTAVDIIGDNGGNWLFIEYNGNKGWVSKNYVDILNLYVVDSGNGITYRDAPAGERSGAIPNESFVVLSLDSNQDIVSEDAKLSGTNYTWYRIYRDGNEYWTANNWLSKVE